ncbi:hypothetical protein BraRD5C2_39440 [Bradyrhizobium sp. RD5-C2]|nr:hypothetical protein BraRD5C2_39440 [Bradyrhizobium sp. RD5-C2]
MKLSGGKNIAELFTATALQVTAPLRSLQLFNKQAPAAKSPSPNDADFRCGRHRVDRVDQPPKRH